MGNRYSFKETGFTLIESLAAMLIITIALVGLAQAFFYGWVFVDKSGRQRQMLGLLQAELDHWSRQHLVSPHLPLYPINKDSLVWLEGTTGEKARLKTTLSPVQMHGNLRFQELDVTLVAIRTLQPDSLNIKTRLYIEE